MCDNISQSTPIKQIPNSHPDFLTPQIFWSQFDHIQLASAPTQKRSDHVTISQFETRFLFRYSNEEEKKDIGICHVMLYIPFGSLKFMILFPYDLLIC